MAALTLSVGSAFAGFTANASNTGNAFGGSTLTLTVNPKGKSTSTPAFNVTGINPGDIKSQVLRLNNTGTGDSTSTVLTGITHSTTTTVDLGDKLLLSVYNDVSGDDTNTGGVVTDPSADDVLVGGPTPITSTIWNNNSLGFGITHGANHQIVLKVQFDPSADNTYQGATSNFDLNFQTAQ